MTQSWCRRFWRHPPSLGAYSCKVKSYSFWFWKTGRLGTHRFRHLCSWSTTARFTGSSLVRKTITPFQKNTKKQLSIVYTSFSVHFGTTRTSPFERKKSGWSFGSTNIWSLSDGRVSARTKHLPPSSSLLLAHDPFSHHVSPFSH